PQSALLAQMASRSCELPNLSASSVSSVFIRSPFLLPRNFQNSAPNHRNYRPVFPPFCNGHIGNGDDAWHSFVLFVSLVFNLSLGSDCLLNRTPMISLTLQTLN